MENDENGGGMPLDGNNDYGNEDYGNNNAGQNPGEDGNNNDDVDQYFDDAGDIGYLPADHVTPLYIF
jgi:hypothetical protein